MIRELVESTGLTVREGNIINLGYANGWYYSEKITKLYSTLTQHKVEGSNTSKTVGRCETEYTFKVQDGSEIYTVVSRVDSGD
jgi:hypothetical protein